jgi:hypothetical protein
MFDLMLTGRYTPPQILFIANDEWGFRTPRGHKISRSNIYNIFSRPFYYGRFEYPVASGNWYTGAHKPMISEAEYRRIQSLLRHSARPKARRGGLQFPYRGPLRCGGCRAMITAEKRTKHQQNGNVHEYVYYHCTRRKDPACRQPALREDRLEQQIEHLLAAIEIPEQFRTWGLEYIANRSQDDATDRKAVADNLRRSIDACERRLDGLIDLRVNGELTEAEFADKKARLAQERDDLQQSLDRLDDNAHDWLEAVDRVFSYAREARSRFAKGGADVRKEIFAALGSNLLLTDKKLTVDGNIWVRPLERAAKEARMIHAGFEPRKTRMDPTQLAALYAHSPRMLRALDDVRRIKDVPDGLVVKT